MEVKYEVVPPADYGEVIKKFTYGNGVVFLHYTGKSRGKNTEWQCTYSSGGLLGPYGYGKTPTQAKEQWKAKVAGAVDGLLKAALA